MGIPFCAIIEKRGEPCLVFQTNGPISRLQKRIELNPADAWNILADYKARDDIMAFSDCLNLTQAQLDEVTRFDPENPTKDRAAHIREITCQKNSVRGNENDLPMLEEAMLGQLKLSESFKFFGQLNLQDTRGPILGIEKAELEKGYQAYLDWRQNKASSGPA